MTMMPHFRVPVKPGAPATTALSPRYVHAGSDFYSELARLRLLEARYDADSIRRFQALGSLRGLRCLEVGAGAGSIVRWLASQVGSEGRAVATDIDPRFLDDLKAENVEVRRHDIVIDDLEEDSFDIVHCRALLLHLADPRRALERMAAAVRSGGALLVEDADYVCLRGCDPAHPLSAAFDRVMHEVLRIFESARLFDPYFGRRLPVLVNGLGLVDCGHEALTRVRLGGSAEAELLRRSTERFRATILEAGTISEADFINALSAAADPTFSFFDALSVSAWGRRRA